jgi:hypothetical protein
MKNFFILTIVFLTFLNIVVHVACKKEPQCQTIDCPGMLECHDNKCSCGPDEIPIGTTTCVRPSSKAFLADGDAGNTLKEKTVIFFHENPDTLNSTNPNVGVYGSLNVRYEGAKQSPQESYVKFDLNPNGLVGDMFDYTAIGRHFPTGFATDGYCNINIRGTWTHPDTLATIVRLISCVPYDIPEADNLYRVKFIRVK